MIKERVICLFLAIVGIVMIFVAIAMEDNKSMSIDKVDTVSISASANMYVKGKKNEKIEATFKEVEMEIIPASVVIPPRTEVYDNMTLEELAAKINRNLGDGYIASKGELIASYCIEKGVVPYIAVAIMLHETGCRAKCSNLVRQCNNVGGQKGSPGCGGGAYKSFSTLDEGIYGFVNNLYKNYYAHGLNTVETIAPRYAEGNTWAGKINWYVNLIKNS